MTRDLALGASPLFLADEDGGLGIAWLDCGGMTSVEDHAPAPSASLAVHPNPFNPRLSIDFALMQAAALRLDVYDITGRRLAGIAEGNYSAGRHQLSWFTEDGSGRPLPSGVYFLNLSTDTGEEVTAKAVLLR